MSSAFAPPRGDADALAAHGSTLGEVAAGLADQTTQVRRGVGLVLISLLQSAQAIRIDELRNGVDGLDHEIALVRRAGETVADIVRDRAHALRRLTDDLDDLRRQAQREPDRRPLLELHADALRDDHRRADHRAGEEIARLTATLADVAPVPASRSILAGADVSLADAWLQVNGAYESIAATRFREEQASAYYQLVGFGESFGRSGTASLEGLRDLVLHPITTGKGFVSFGHAVVTDPDGTTRSVWHQVVDPYADDWEHHEYGQAIGRGAEALVELLVGGEGVGEAEGPGHHRTGGDRRRRCSRTRTSRPCARDRGPDRPGSCLREARVATARVPWRLNTGGPLTTDRIDHCRRREAWLG